MTWSEQTRDYLCLTLIGFLGAFSFTVVHPVLPLYVQSFHVPYEQVGAFFSAYALTWTVLQVYTGYLADRLGRKRIALIGLTIYAAFALLNYTSRNFTQLLLFRILQGVGLGLLGPAVLGLYVAFDITIPLAGKARGLSTSQIGVVLASYSLSFTLLQVPIGAYAERTDRRRLLASASFLSALFFFGLYAARGFLPLVFLMALLGITLGAVFIQATARAAEVVAEGTQVTSLAFFDSLIDLSFTVMPLIVGFTARFGETVPFLACTLFLASAGVLFQLTKE